MGSADWRSPDGYSNLLQVDAPGFAWEFLRRNSEFLKDHESLSRATDQHRRTTEEHDAFALRWGIRFARNVEQTPIWVSRDLPSVTCVTEASAALANPAFNLPRSAMRALAKLPVGEYLLEGTGAVLRVQTLASEIKSFAVLLPLDQLFDVRVSAALQLWQRLNGKPSKAVQMMSLSQRKRYVLTLRALDGRLARASYREIAHVLFGLDDASGSAWKGHDLRDRTIRLVRLGTNLMVGDYKRLLLYPHRRKLP